MSSNTASRDGKPILVQLIDEATDSLAQRRSLHSWLADQPRQEDKLSKLLIRAAHFFDRSNVRRAIGIGGVVLIIVGFALILWPARRNSLDQAGARVATAGMVVFVVSLAGARPEVVPRWLRARRSATSRTLAWFMISLIGVLWWFYFSEPLLAGRVGAAAVAIVGCVVATTTLPGVLEAARGKPLLVELRAVTTLTCGSVLLFIVAMISSIGWSSEVRTSLVVTTLVATGGWLFHALDGLSKGVAAVVLGADSLIDVMKSEFDDGQSMVGAGLEFVRGLSQPVGVRLPTGRARFASGEVRFAVEVACLPERIWATSRALPLRDRRRAEIARAIGALAPAVRRELILDYAVYVRNALQP